MKRITILLVFALFAINFSACAQKEYYELSDVEYAKILKSKDKKQITLKDGSLGYIMMMEEIAVVGVLSREQLNQLRRVACIIPLAPGDPCGDDDECRRRCPEGYVCTSITRPRISLDLEHVNQNDLLKIKEKGKSLKGNIVVIRPAIKKCIALPNSLRN